MRTYSTVLFAVLGFISNTFSQIDWTTHIVTPSKGATTDNATDVITFDVENDGDVDIVSASFSDNKVAWYENDGHENFLQHIISNNAIGVSTLDTVDMEGDGDMDLLSDAAIEDRIYWYENDGQGTFISHIIYSNDKSEFTWATYSVDGIDLDNDGDIDAVNGGWHDPVLKWHENDGSNLNFETHILDTLGERFTVIASDLDDDGDIDIIATCQYPSLIVWYENDGTQNFSRYTISDAPTKPRIVIAIDLDKDNDVDIAAAHYEGEVAWYENDGQKNFITHNISNSPTCNVIYVADIDYDDDLDIVTGDPDENPSNNHIGWLENDGQQNFTYHIITSDLNWSSSVWADDVDSDGDMDVLFTALNSDNVAWCESDLIDDITKEKNENIPLQFSLHQNYPNPFNPSTTIEFTLPKSEFIVLKVYSILGKEVSTIVSKKLNQGNHSYTFNGKNLASGVYYYRFEAGDYVNTRKMIYLK